MRSRVAKLTCGAVAWIAFGAAAFFIIQSEKQLAEVRAAGRSGARRRASGVGRFRSRPTQAAGARDWLRGGARGAVDHAARSRCQTRGAFHGLARVTRGWLADRGGSIGWRASLRW